MKILKTMIIPLSTAIIVSNALAGTIDRSQNEALLALLNKYRTDNGKNELVFDKYLMAAAEVRAQEQYLLWGHQRPDLAGIAYTDPRYGEVIDTNYYTSFTETANKNNIYYGAYAENLAVQGFWNSATGYQYNGYQFTPQMAMDGWKKSPGHNANMLDQGATSGTGTTTFGVAHYKTDDGREIWVQLFGNPGNDINNVKVTNPSNPFGTGTSTTTTDGSIYDPVSQKVLYVGQGSSINGFPTDDNGNILGGGGGGSTTGGEEQTPPSNPPSDKETPPSNPPSDKETPPSNPPSDTGSGSQNGSGSNSGGSTNSNNTSSGSGSTGGSSSNTNTNNNTSTDTNKPTQKPNTDKTDKEESKEENKPTTPSKPNQSEQDKAEQEKQEAQKAEQERLEQEKQEAEQKAQEEAEQKAKEEAEEKARQEAEQKAAEEKAKQEAEEKAKEEAMKAVVVAMMAEEIRQSNPQFKALSEGAISAVTTVLAAADTAATSGMDEANKATSANAATLGAGQTAMAAFGATGGGSMRYKSGSHVDVKGVNVLAGVGFSREFNEGKIMLAPFVEAGWSKYNTYNSFNNAASVEGDGDSSFVGFGALLRYDISGASHPYIEASVRAGELKNKYNAGSVYDRAGNVLEYTTHTPYFSAHVGAGYIFDLGEGLSLDIGAKYLFTHVKSDKVNVAGDKFSFGAVNSHRLRASAKVEKELNENVSVYGGMAYEYEFKGSADASINGRAIKAPSIKGGSGMAEVGFGWYLTKNVRLDISAQGWVGKKQGVNGNIGIKINF